MDGARCKVILQHQNLVLLLEMLLGTLGGGLYSFPMRIVPIYMTRLLQNIILQLIVEYYFFH
jgi:hypothetical protein